MIITAVPVDYSNYKEDGISSWNLSFGIMPQNDTIYRHGGSISYFQFDFAFIISKKIATSFFVNCDKGNVLNEKLEASLEMQ